MDGVFYSSVAAIAAERTRLAKAWKVSEPEVVAVSIHDHSAGDLNGYEGSHDGVFRIPDLANFLGACGVAAEVVTDHNVADNAQWRLLLDAADRCGAEGGVRFGAGTETSTRNGHFIVITDDREFEPPRRKAPVLDIVRDVFEQKAGDPRHFAEVAIPHPGLSRRDPRQMVLERIGLGASMKIEDIISVLKLARQEGEIVHVECRNGLTSANYRIGCAMGEAGRAERWGKPHITQATRDLFRETVSWYHGADGHEPEQHISQLMFFRREHVSSGGAISVRKVFDTIRREKALEADARSSGKRELGERLVSGFSTYDALDLKHRMAAKVGTAAYYADCVVPFFAEGIGIGYPRATRKALKRAARYYGRMPNPDAA
jgi:hypothetical protein